MDVEVCNMRGWSLESQSGSLVLFDSFESRMYVFVRVRRRRDSSFVELTAIPLQGKSQVLFFLVETIAIDDVPFTPFWEREYLYFYFFILLNPPFSLYTKKIEHVCLVYLD